MYSFVLMLHSWWRWAVVALVLIATIRAVAGRLSGRTWTDGDKRSNRLATISLDVQMLLGLLLYLWLSPFTTEAFRDFGTAMRESGLRFWAVEHLTLMVGALIIAHVGNVRAMKASSDSARHLRGALFFGVALLLVLIGTPWPGMPNGRELFRFGR